MRGLYRVGVAFIVLGVLIPICTFFGPILWNRVHRFLHVAGPSIVHFGNEFVQRVVVSMMASVILILFGILFTRDAARREKPVGRPDEERI